MAGETTAPGIHLPDLRLAAPAALRVLVSLIAVTGAAWALTLYHATYHATSGISVEHWSFAGLAVFIIFWTVLMVAMMLPGAAPMVLTLAALQAQRDRHVAVPTLIFVAGYIFVWAYAGLVVYVVVHAGKNVVDGLAWLNGGVWAQLALGVTLTVAGLYQFTPLKRVCLCYCRSPFALMALHWSDGRDGAFDMGMRHGLVCLGCYWALFTALIVAGMMGIAWMLPLTLVVFAEKVLPHAFRISVAVGVGFSLWG
jgi:predicted metal-binding membrane protein